jgi:single-stranded DNA-binding protein
MAAIKGRVGKDPEQFQYKGGTKTATKFSVAVGDKPNTTWYDAVCWNEGLAAAALDRLSKGSQVEIEGEVTDREYGGKTYHNLKVDEFTVDGDTYSWKDEQKSEFASDGF